MCFNFCTNDYIRNGVCKLIVMCWIVVYISYENIHDRLVGWWIIDYIMLRCYGWNQDRIFF